MAVFRDEWDFSFTGLRQFCIASLVDKELQDSDGVVRGKWSYYMAAAGKAVNVKRSQE